MKIVHLNLTFITLSIIFIFYGYDMMQHTPLSFYAIEQSAIKIDLQGWVDNLKYRILEDTNWILYSSGTIINLEAGKTLQFERLSNQISNGNSGTYYMKFGRFNIEGKVSAYGNIQSLLNYSDNVPDWAFNELFSHTLGYIVNLVNSPPLCFAKTIGNGSYSEMFRDNPNIVMANYYLPAEILKPYCYSGMFINCTSLKYSPTVEGKYIITTNNDNSSGCMKQMFSGCTSLIHTMSSINIKNMKYSLDICTRMYENCINLKTAPKIKTEKAGYMNSMFLNCKSLESIDLSEIKKGINYSGMLAGCTSLKTVSLPNDKNSSGTKFESMLQNCSALEKIKIPAEEIGSGSLQYMLSGCSNLSEIEVNFTNWSYIYNWVDGVSSKGIFIKPSSLSEEYGSNKIPTGWTVVNK